MHSPVADGQHPTRVLVVDADRRVRASLERLITMSDGFTCVRTVDNPADALAALETQPVDAVLIDLDEGADRIEFAGTVCIAIATANGIASRRSRIVGGREWVRLGAVEMGLDCLRRHLQGLPGLQSRSRSGFDMASYAPRT